MYFKSILKISHSNCLQFYNNLPVKLSFLFTNKTLRLNNLKTRKGMNAKISVFVICAKAIIYLLLYNLHDCNLKEQIQLFSIVMTKKTEVHTIRPEGRW